MGPFVFLVLVMIVMSEAERSNDTYPLSENSESAMCVCRPHVTINPPVCARSPPKNLEIGCNSSTVQHVVSLELENTNSKVATLQDAVSTNQDMVTFELRNTTLKLKDTRRQMEELLVAVSGNQETVASELRNTTLQLQDTRRQMEELQVAVSGNQETVTFELQDTRRKMDELQVAVSGNQETVTSELEDTRRKMDKLQESVSSVIKLLTTSGGLLVDFSVKDCSDILKRGATKSGVYKVKPLNYDEPFSVYCDMETDGGGWTVFQRRKDGSVDFYLDFANYSRGFGDLEGEFWLGNDNLHRLTAQGEYELRVDLSDFENRTGYAVYDSFSIADVSDNYRLTVGNYSGTAGDKLAYHNSQVFSTKDRDNDAYSRNCAVKFHGAWWYRACHYSNLNGEYYNGYTSSIQAIKWFGFSGSRSLKTTEMKIRSKVYSAVFESLFSESEFEIESETESEQTESEK